MVQSIREALWDLRADDNFPISCECTELFTKEEYVEQGKCCDPCRKFRDMAKKFADLPD